jgi:type II secretory pathway predicted ATPase ExeA
MSNIILNHFGLSHLPFSKQSSSDCVIKTAAFNDAFAMLSLGIESEDILLLTGPVGSGKSLTLKSFIQSLEPNKYHPVYLRGNLMSPVELVKSVLIGMMVDPPFSPSKAKAAYFKCISDSSKKVIIIIDDAKGLKDSVLSCIKNLTNFEYDSKNKVSFVLCGQPELREKLSYTLFLPVRERIRISFHMEGMSSNETCQYIDHQLKACGRSTALFSDDAKEHIFKRSKGISRIVNRLCFQAMLKAAASGKSIIESSFLPNDNF